MSSENRLEMQDYQPLTRHWPRLLKSENDDICKREIDRTGLWQVYWQRISIIVLKVFLLTEAGLGLCRISAEYVFGERRYCLVVFQN